MTQELTQDIHTEQMKLMTQTGHSQRSIIQDTQAGHLEKAITLEKLHWTFTQDNHKCVTSMGQDNETQQSHRIITAVNHTGQLHWQFTQENNAGHSHSTIISPIYMIIILIIHTGESH